jgi:hypothetical protein
MEDISFMTGQNNFNAPRGLTLDELKLVGNSMGKVGGHFKLIGLSKEKGDDDKYPVLEFPQKEPLTVIFLIVRRRLVESTQDGLKRWTSEHDTPNDVVQLFGENKDRAPASELKVRHENLRTEQVIYVRYKGEIYRLRVKGVTLKPTDPKKDGYTSFYTYLQTFKDGESFWQYATKMTPVEVDTATGTNWAINFERGPKLNDDQIKEVVENIKHIYNSNKKVDEYYNKPAAPVATTYPDSLTSEKDAATSDDGFYPADEINPEDIPF